jgi:hypothetical protein
MMAKSDPQRIDEWPLAGAFYAKARALYWEFAHS